MVRTQATSSPAATPDAERSGVVGKAVVRAADALGLTKAELSRTLGLSDTEVSRLKDGNFALEPSSKAYELALLLIRLFQGVDEMVAGEEHSTRRWMASTNTALAGQQPRMSIQCITGLVATVEYVDSARSRLKPATLDE